MKTTKKFDFPAWGKQVQYLPLNQLWDLKKLTNKAKTLLFIRFDQFVDIRLAELSKPEAIKLFNHEARVASTPENAVQTIMELFHAE